METKAFGVPQRQSVIGVLLIFTKTLYKIMRGFWVLGVYLIIKTPTGPMLYYIILGSLILGVAVLIYSYFYYRNFLFHIDYDKEEFVLQKGIFSTENIAIPFDKIQQVYFKRSIMQRVLNIYSVVIDTAGSKSEEVGIRAVSKENALLLASILTDVKKEPSESDAPEESPETKIWTHKLDIPTLLKIGISTNYIRGFALVVAFFATIYNELGTFFSDYTETLETYFDKVPEIADSLVFVFIALVIVLLIVSIVITVFEVFIKYYGLKLVQTPESLELEMGLKTNTKVKFQPRRVQLVQVVTNPVQKWMNLYEARVALASSENSLQKKKIRIPGLKKEILKKLRSFLYGNTTSRFKKTFKPHKLLLFRRIFIAFIPILISYVLLLLLNYMDFFYWIFLAVLYGLVAIVYQIKAFRSLELTFTEEFLHKKQGVWSKKDERFEIFKMQAVTVKEPFWYKRRNLVNVIFHTAGGDVSFRAVNIKILTYLNYLLYKVESNSKKWM